MDPNESGLSSYFQHHQQIPPPLSAVPPVSGGGVGINVSPNNGVIPNINTTHHHGSHPNPTALGSATSSSPMAYSNTVPSAVSTGLEGMKKKRGRPRKYATPEEAAAAKRQSSASNSGSAQLKKKQQVYGGGMISGSKSDANATSGDKITPHVIVVPNGEDVHHRIMSFVQQLKGEMCILSASGQVSNVSLNQSATSGGSVTYEGIYNINTLNGSFVRTEHGGRSGGLSISFAVDSSTLIGGGVGGPLIAYNPVQVIVGTFVVDRKKDNSVAEASAGKSPSPVGVGGGPSMSGLSFRSPNDLYQNYTGGSQYMNMQ